MQFEPALIHLQSLHLEKRTNKPQFKAAYEDSDKQEKPQQHTSNNTKICENDKRRFKSYFKGWGPHLLLSLEDLWSLEAERLPYYWDKNDAKKTSAAFSTLPQGALLA